jgi:hypothetical protein
MKIFLLIYDRSAKRLLRVEEYEQAERDRALRDRHDAEVAAMEQHRDEEIVLFEAESLDALKRTHGSYFYTVRELGERLRDLAS